MNNYTFKNERTNKEYKRINKTAARAAYVSGKNVIICACNMRPFSLWHPEVEVNYNDRDETENETPAADYFTKLVMYYEVYTCINNETGRYAAFYIEL